jgi:antitoxin (DNA-binding transcriptional repressor) of toxin-antitoxin stability system
MVQVTADEARARLPELLAAAEGGEGIEIRAENGRTFRLIANRPRPPVTGVPRAGSCQGLIEVLDDWDVPLDELGEYMG